MALNGAPSPLSKRSTAKDGANAPASQGRGLAVRCSVPLDVEVDGAGVAAAPDEPPFDVDLGSPHRELTSAVERGPS